MKVISRSITAVLMIFLFVHGITSQGSTIVDDIIIETDNGTIYCDSMICPPGAISCHVTKRNDPNDFSQIIRNRRCFAINGAIIAKETIYEPNTYQGNVNINVVSGGGGANVVRELTPEEQRQLEENLRRTHVQLEQTLSNTHQQIADTLSGVYDSLRPFRDGSFSANLRNRINAEIRENLHNALKY